MRFIIGIDEAGRGPLAGPVTVGVFRAPEKFKTKLIKLLGGRIKDSKQLSPEKRSSIFKELKKLMISGEVDFRVAHSSSKIIDRIGISKAISRAIANSLKKLYHTSLKYNGAHCIVRLDGLLKAPPRFKNQKTIIGGDAKDVFIACASIVAKVSRDRLMCRLARRYPLYAFHIHKGYGTKLHQKMLREHGLSDLHRVSFCAKV